MRGILAAAGSVGLVAGALLLQPGLSPLTVGWTRGLAAGALLGAAGSLGGFLLLLRNLRAGHARFLGALFGGMLARWMLFGVVLVLVARGGALPIGAFLGGLIPSYLGFQAAEMWMLHRAPSGAGEAMPGGPETRR